MIGQLEVITDGEKTHYRIPVGNFLVVGRSSSADIVLDDSSVSKLHCKIIEKKGLFYLEDLKSRNFTHLNNERIEGVRAIRDGDCITVGRTEIHFSRISQRSHEHDVTKPIQKMPAQTAPPKLSTSDYPPPPPPSPPSKSFTTSAQSNVDDAFFVNIALSLPNCPVSREHVAECLALSAQNPNKSLQEIFVQKGYLTQENIKTVERTLANILGREAVEETPPEKVDNEEQRNKEKLFLNVAQIKGLLNRDKVQKCAILQRKYAAKKVFLKPHEIVAREKLLTQAQINEIWKIINLELVPKLDGYQMLALIGLGGMGYIYKARQLSMDRIVAIKVISEEYQSQPQFRELFLKEARAVARLNHENIIAGYDFGESNGISFFVMEYASGGSVQEELNKNSGRLSAERSLSIITQVTKALEHAQARNLVHRDIKPQNMLLSEENMVKLCDLGLAQRIDQENKKRGKEFGTPAFMSPEQIRCEPNIDVRSDIYALGVTFFRLLCGRLPFVGNSSEMMAKHLTEPLKFSPEEENECREITKIIAKMMTKDRKDRYQDPSKLLEDLQNAEKRMSGEEIPKPKDATKPLPTIKRRKKRKVKAALRRRRR